VTAKAIDTRSAETARLGPQGESAVAQPFALNMLSAITTGETGNG
jgi:hypothetical protein